MTPPVTAGRLGHPVAMAVLLLAGIFPAAHGAPPAVVVEQSPVSVERRTFDPLHPPADMPPLTPLEAGLCWTNFAFESQVGIEGPKVANPRHPTLVTGVTVKLSLTVIIWTIEQPSDKLRAHEETHLEIAEIYYSRASSIAQRLGENLIGRKLAVPVDDSPAMKQALDRLEKDLLVEFKRKTAERCALAQAQFDLITNHGLNPISEHDAMARALEVEAASP